MLPATGIMNENPPNRSTQSEVKDSLSVSSQQTGTTQTRFSFYNAQDFVQKPTSTPNTASPSKKETPAQPTANRDSVEILRSLQEHEQQRLEILGANGSTNDRSNSTGRVNGIKEASFRIDLAVATASSDVSNPYEDAIKEALDLLRKHRSPKEPFGTVSQASTPAVSNAIRSSSPGRDSAKQQSKQLLDELDMVVSRTPPEGDRILKLREEVSFTHEKNKQDETNGQDAADEVAGYDGGPRPLQDQALANPTSAALGEAYQAEIETRRKQRQERMARYATRLAELKQEDKYVPVMGETGKPGGSSSSDVGQSWGGPRLDTITSWHPTSDSAPTSRSVPSAFPDLTTNDTDSSDMLVPTVPVPSRVSKDEDVQRGVERVLLAILERANSQGRGTRVVDQTEPAVQDVPTDSPWRTSTSEEKKAATPENSRPSLDDADGGNALVRAMTDLLGVPSTSTLGSSSPNNNALQLVTANTDQELVRQHEADSSNQDREEEEESFNQSTPTETSWDFNRKTTLTVDTSFQGADHADSTTADRDESPEDDLDKMVRTVLVHDTSEIKSKKEDLINRKVRSVLSPNPDKRGDEDDDNCSGTVDKDESSYDDGAFGDDDDEGDDNGQNEDYNIHNELDGVLGPLSKRAGGTTGVVLETDFSDQQDSGTSPSLLDSLSAAVSLVTGTLTDETNDKYALNEVDDETIELMETLCAHLFQANSIQSTGVIEDRPEWDESNPDEAGYRIIRLSTVQLAAVEYAFERMMESVKLKRETDEQSDSDDAFERDLKAAEDLLDGQENDKKLANLTSKNKLDAEIAERERIYPKEQPLPNFPGVKSTGHGEMGDLEYFYLPIIYKSHVTGFEPTKDLVLEAGNVVAGQYLVEGELGSAAFSTAYRCVDLNADGDGPDGHDEVCLKVIKNTKDFFDQSLDEIKILELLRQTGMCHEMNIVEMRTFFYHREHLIIVTELLRQNLFEFGKFIVDSNEEPYFTMTRLCYLTRQILVALDFIHRLGLVHSDVKPENILLSSYSRAQVKVIDFGSSCFLTDRQSSYIQSRSYRAPEVILGLPYDGRIDVWSLGCVVAEMYTGEVTFQNDSIVSMLSRIEAICGTLPSDMISQGRQSGRFFTKCGLLFEKLPGGEHDDSHSEESDDDDDTSSDRRKRYVDVFQPKLTTLSARLGFSRNLMKKYKSSSENMSNEETQQAVFVDFIQKLLTIDPDKRPTSAEALEHPWMKYAESLTEEDIKYPSN